MDACQFTDAALRDAFAAIRLPAWPDFDVCMADALYSRLIRGAAWRAAQGRPIGRTVQRPPVVRPAAPFPFPTHQPARHDRKRAAAGDTDE